MDDQPAPGMNFGDWFLRWLDLVGECEKASGRMIDDYIKVAARVGVSTAGERGVQVPFPALVPVTKSLLSSETANGSCSGQYCCERFRCDSVYGWLARAEFNLHFTNHGHTCWMENGGLKTTISEDSPTSEAPLYSLDVKVLPPPGEICESRSAASARIAPIAMDEERVEEGSRVELAGLVRDVGLNGKRGICMGRAPDGERWLIALPGGRRINVKMSNIKPASDLDTEIVQRE